MVQDCKSNKLSNVLDRFTWNLPLALIMVRINGENLELQQIEYFKILDLSSKSTVYLSSFNKIPTIVTTRNEC
jgi:hypothetical protein